MKNLVCLFMLLVVIACQPEKKNYYNTTIEEKVEETLEVEQEPEVAEVEEETVRREFSGYFNLSGPSDANCIYLDEKVENVVDIETDCFSLVTENPKDNSLGEFPAISGSNLVVRDDEIRFTKNVNYTSGNDIEEDATGSNITGSKRTDYRFYFKDDRLTLTIKIYDSSINNNVNEVIATRIFKEL
jgi:hypothetical protein